MIFLFLFLQSFERLHVVEGTAGYALQFVVMQKSKIKIKMITKR